MLCLTLYVHAAARSAQSASLAPLGHTSQVVVSSGRSSSTAQVRLPLSDALSGSSALSVHCGVTHSSELAPVHSVLTGKQRLKTSWVR